MNIIFLFDDPFPIGMAATNRILSLAKGLMENDARVFVYCLNPYELEGKPLINPDAEGIYEGIRYKYFAGTTVWPKRKINKLRVRIKSFVKSIGELRRLKSGGNLDVVILCSNKPSHILFYFILTSLLGVTYLQEKSEFPFVLRRKGRLGRTYAWLYTTFIYKVFHGMILMTTPLKEYFQNRIRRNAKIEVIPMTVEAERFSQYNGQSPYPFPYIGYCGYMGGNKDGVDILIRSFKLIADTFNDIKLVLIGGAEHHEMQRLMEISNDLGLQSRVLFTGKMERDAMPAYLCNAKILALARPSGLQSLGGFPTKLGEYLATGNPVVVTKVGEIPFYLRDGENAYLVEPDSHELFAAKLGYVLSNYKTAIKVGKKGSELAVTLFNYRYQSKRILKFLESLK